MRRASRRKIILVTLVLMLVGGAGGVALLWQEGEKATSQVAVSPFFPDVDPALLEELSLGFAAPPQRDLASVKVSKEEAIRIAEQYDGIKALDAALVIVDDYGKPADVLDGLRGPARPGPQPVPNNGDSERLGPGPGEHFQCLCWVVRWDPEPIWWAASNPTGEGAYTVIWYPALVLTIVDARTGEINWSAASGQRKPTEEHKGGPLPPPWGKQ